MASPDGPKRILVVDDEPEIVNLLREALEGVGFEVDAAADGQSAIQAVRERIFDAAIVDFSLPDMNGLVVHREIRQLDEELARHTLFMSGYVQSKKDLGYYSTYGIGFISKPFDIAEIIDSLESMWTVEESS